jgi:hypothetical protein
MSLAEESRARCSQNQIPDQIPITSQPDEKIALMRTAVLCIIARAVRSVRENVGGGWGEIDREVMTDYQKKCSGGDPEVLA